MDGTVYFFFIFNGCVHAKNNIPISQKDNELRRIANIKMIQPGIKVASENIIGNATIPAPNNALIVLFVVDKNETDCGSNLHPGATLSSGNTFALFHNATFGYLSKYDDGKLKSFSRVISRILGKGL